MLLDRPLRLKLQRLQPSRIDYQGLKLLTNLPGVPQHPRGAVLVRCRSTLRSDHLSILVLRPSQILGQTTGEDTHLGTCLFIKTLLNSTLQVERRQQTAGIGHSRTLLIRDLLAYRPISRCKQPLFCIKILRNVHRRLPTTLLRIG